MASIKQNSLPFKPYARLMNIIGDQLITDKKVAVVEIIKNSYDADAENVYVRFFNMQNIGFNDLPKEQQAYIEIEDDGHGMTSDIIENVWLRPATPNKLDKKKNNKNTTKKGRIIQGEKGIGRFAVHKLGEMVELYTKSTNHDEIKLLMDFTEYNPESSNLFNQQSNYKLLEDVSNDWFINNPSEVIKKESGTLIRISHLREGWSDKDLQHLYKTIQRLIPPVDENAEKLGVTFIQDFNIEVFENGRLYVSEQATTFKDVIENAHYTMIGEVSNEGVLTFSYTSVAPQRSIQKTVSLLDNNTREYSFYFNKHWEERSKPQCGSFKFTLYAFDLSKSAKVVLNKDIEAFIKDNFVYVLRDGVRIFPYGEKGIDWLDLDKLRSTIRAGDFLSYNDLTGFVYITQNHNPNLKDSTNRQGIMDLNGALEDFKMLVLSATEVFNTEIKIDKNKMELSNSVSIKNVDDNLLKATENLKSSLTQIEHKDTLEKANKFISTVQKHTELLKEQVETVEDLAGLGMAVEKSSHDALRLLSLMRSNIRDFIVKVRKDNYTDEELLTLLEELDENILSVYDEMQIIQPIFKSQRKTIKDISVYDSIEKVVKYFRRDINNKISVIIEKDEDIIVRTNQGLMLQVIINLLDNAIFWVNKSESSDKKIQFTINSENKTLIISDNGTGIREDVKPLIYQRFFSMKPAGRGLGLYIVKELLLRINADIFILDDNKVLSGANFIIKFNTKED